MMQRFEAEFARLHGCRFGVMSNSGTSALHIALQAMKELHGWDDGDEVILPAVTFVATANIVLQNRMQPVLADVDPTYYELDPSLIEEKITPRTRAIIPVHLFGHPADMSPICEIASRHGLKIIEDSAETMFASYDGRLVGSLGDIACFSTYSAHLLVTGVGGLNTTNDPDYAIRLRSLMNHGRDSIYISIDDDDDKSAEELRTIIAKRFQFVSVGHSFRVTEMEAALGLAQLEEREGIIGARRQNARSLIAKLSHLDACLQLPQIRPGSEHSFMMLPIVLRDEPKEAIVNFLELHGVETRDMLPLTNQPVYHRLLDWREEDYPVAQWINRNGFYVGCHQGLTEVELDYVAELFERYFRRSPRQDRDGACLILTVSDHTTNVDELFQKIPVELFERIVVLDAGATADTIQFMRDQGSEIVPLNGEDPLHLVQRGAVPIEQTNLVFFVADGRYHPSDISRLLLTLERGSDMVIASRFLSGGARHDRTQRIRYRSMGNRGLTLLANILFYGTTSDALSSLRAIRKHRLVEVNVAANDLVGFYQLSLASMQRGWKIAELPTVELLNPELENRWRIWADGLRLVWVLLREWWRSRPKSPSTSG